MINVFTFTIIIIFLYCITFNTDWFERSFHTQKIKSKRMLIFFLTAILSQRYDSP